MLEDSEEVQSNLLLIDFEYHQFVFIDKILQIYHMLLMENTHLNTVCVLVIFAVNTWGNRCERGITESNNDELAILSDAEQTLSLYRFEIAYYPITCYVVHLNYQQHSRDTCSSLLLCKEQDVLLNYRYLQAS